jgi:hypothetical protein
MQYRFKLGALAWGIAAAMAFPAGAAASNGAGMLTLPAGNNNSALCNQLATGNTNAVNQCRQENTATNTQTATATGGAGGSATGGNAGPVQVVGNGSRGGSYGGDAYANGGDAEAHNRLDNEQSNQISGRDSSSESYAGVGNNNSDVCKQLASGDTFGNDQCHQSNTATNTQTATATGGAGGSATGGNGGPVQVVGDDSQGYSSGGDAYANGGDAEAHNSLENEQSNQISGRDSSGSGHNESDETMSDPTGNNNSAVCNQLATGNTNAANQCRQENTATNTQTATATGGAGGSATGGNAGPVQIVGNGSRGDSYGGDAYANGGDAESQNSLENEQSNQISGRDSSGSGFGWDGYNNSAICNLLATGDTFGNDQCHQSNTATNTQTATATGGAGGSATAGYAGPSQVVRDDYEGGSYGGDAYANGGDAESQNNLENEQSNQISGRDNQTSGPRTKHRTKKAKKSKKWPKSRMSRFVR